ncbi:MAG: hypothetical protein N3I86_02925 [Verrucomicrobiae bacterium]|nr:hypothetical protein [Verrucomicrobiae bacterium]
MNPDELRDRQLEQLREAAKIFLKPMERLPFPVVIEAMTGRQVLPVLNRSKDAALLDKLARACIVVVAGSQSEPFTANRPNDVSTQVEEKLEVALKACGIGVERPRAEQGRTPGGYPDRLLWNEGEPTYLEVKVSREQNISQGSARNFFYQPTTNPKIGHDARHLLAGFAIKETSEKRWVLTGWKIVDLWYLRVKLKP